MLQLGGNPGDRGEITHPGAASLDGGNGFQMGAGKATRLLGGCRGWACALLRESRQEATPREKATSSSERDPDVRSVAIASGNHGSAGCGSSGDISSGDLRGGSRG